MSLEQPKERTCIYCGGLIIVDNVMSLDQIVMGKPRCSCPNVKKAEAEGGSLIHWAKRKQSVFSMCSDPNTHVETAHLVSLKSEPLPDDTKVTCLDCLALHAG